jgi:hypothetical protein
MVPRASSEPATLISSTGKTYSLPPHTSVILNITSIHYNETYGPSTTLIRPLADDLIYLQPLAASLRIPPRTLHGPKC